MPRDAKRRGKQKGPPYLLERKACAWMAFAKGLAAMGNRDAGEYREVFEDWWLSYGAADAAAEPLFTTIGELRTALGDVIEIVTRIGGFMPAEDQQRLRNARCVHGGL